MLDRDLKQGADEFIGYLRSTPDLKEFHVALDLFGQDPFLKKLKKKYVSLERAFREKEMNATLTNEDIGKLRNIQNAFNQHPVTLRYAGAQQALGTLLKDCNDSINEVIGIDFAAFAAAGGSC